MTFSATARVTSSWSVRILCDLQKPAPAVVLEGVRPPDVADHGPRIPVAGLVHDAGQINR